MFLETIRSSIKPFVIAEAADAHYGDMGRALEMIRLAKESGADAIKFQHHLPDAEMLRDIPQSSNMKEPLYDFLKQNALTIEQHGELQAECARREILYLCTPFSLEAARELENSSLPPIAYKIGSGEMLDFPTIRAIAEFGKPLIVSTGMSYLSEVDEAYEFLRSTGVSFALMNCLSAYPPEPSELRIGFTRVMVNRYPEALIGFSDHTDSIYSSIAAVALGAKILEKHVTVDSDLEGPDSASSITFDQLADLVTAVEIVSAGLGEVREVTESEEEIRVWARRSLVYLKNLEEGHVVSDGDIWGKRPGTGVPSMHLDKFIGRQLARDVAADTLLAEADFVD